MKTSKIKLKTVLVAALFFTGMQLFTACHDDETKTLKDTVNTKNLEEYTAAIASMTSLDEVPEEIQSSVDAFSEVMNETEIEKYAAVDANDVVDAIEASMTLSSSEKSQLQANNEEVYNTVINRITNSVYAFVSSSDLDNLSATMQSNPELSKHLVQTTSSNDFYADDYYQGVVDFQNYITDLIIPNFEKVAALEASAEINASAKKLKSAVELTEAEKEVIAYMKAQGFVNIDMTSQVYIYYLTYVHEGGSLGS